MRVGKIFGIIRSVQWSRIYQPRKNHQNQRPYFYCVYCYSSSHAVAEAYFLKHGSYILINLILNIKSVYIYLYLSFRLPLSLKISLLHEIFCVNNNHLQFSICGEDYYY